MTNHHERPLPEEPRNPQNRAAAGGANQPPRLRLVPSAGSEPGPEALHLARVALTNVLGRSQSQGLSETNAICQAVAAYVATELPGAGDGAPPPLPQMPRRPWPHGGQVLRGLHMTREDLAEEFGIARDADEQFPVFPARILDGFFPQEIQVGVAAIICENAGVFGGRGARSLRIFSARGRTRATKRRPAGRPAAGTVERRRAGLLTIARTLVSMPKDGPGAVLLSSWTHVPQLERPDRLATGVQSNAGPTTGELRRAWRELDRRATELLGISPTDPRAEAIIRSRSDFWLYRNGALFPLLRTMTLFILLTIGLRIGAITRLTRADFVLDRRGPEPDEYRGPALCVRPGKSLAPDVERWKLLTHEQGCVVRAMLAFLECHRAAIGRRRVKDGDPLDPPAPADELPLLVASRTTLSPWAEGAVRAEITGLMPCGDFPGRRPLIVRTRGTSRGVPAQRRGFVGYHLHGYRHSAAPLGERAGELWNAEHPVTGAEPRYEPQLYATALLDQAPKGSRMLALYADRLTPDFYELLSARAIAGIWRLLTTDDGSRREPDFAAIAVQRALVSRRTEALAEAEHQIDVLFDQRVTTADVRTAVTQSAELERLRGRVEHDRRRAHDALESASRELHALEHDRSRWRVVPDDRLPAEREPDHEVGDEAPVRDWVTASELAHLLGVTFGTVWLWLQGRGLDRERPERPWSAEAIPADRARRRARRIWVPGIAPTALTPEAAARLRTLLCDWPAEQGWMTAGRPGARCTSRMDLPPGFSEAYGASTLETLAAYLDWLEGER